MITTEALFKAALIVFLNKIDIFAKTLKSRAGKIAFGIFFPEYSTEYTTTEAANLVRLKFDEMFERRFEDHNKGLPNTALFHLAQHKHTDLNKIIGIFFH